MANPYVYTGPGTRWAEGDGTAEDYLNVGRNNTDYLHAALGTIMDMDAADGVVLAAGFTVDDDGWVGLGASAGRLVFDSTPATDVVSVMSANVGIGGTPSYALDVSTTTDSELAIRVDNNKAAGQGDALLILDKAANGNSAAIQYHTGGTLKWSMGTGIAAVDDNFRLHDGVAGTIIYVERASAVANTLNLVQGKVGLGTATVPHGGVGAALLALEGADASTSGPHVQFTTAADDYPLLQILPWTHDTIDISFDAYFDGTNWKSSDAGSSFMLQKAGDTWKLNSAVAAAGATIATWTNDITVTSAGLVGVGGTPGAKLHVNSGDLSTRTLRLQADTYPIIDLYMDNAHASARNWRIASTYNSMGQFELLRGSTQGGEPTTPVFKIDQNSAMTYNGGIQLNYSTGDGTVGLKLGSTGVSSGFILADDNIYVLPKTASGTADGVFVVCKASQVGVTGTLWVNANTGNVGIGVVPPTTYASYTALYIGGTASLYSIAGAAAADGTTGLSQNVKRETDSNWEYLATDEASLYQQAGGIHYFYAAVSGNAGTVISWDTPLQISRTLISPNVPLDMNGLELILDADGDASITADTDDQIDFKLGNVDKFRFTAVDNVAQLQVLGADHGTGTGAVFVINRNTNASTPAAGTLVIYDKGGTAYYIWVDDAGTLRIGTDAPTNANDLSGTVVGAQTAP